MGEPRNPEPASLDALRTFVDAADTGFNARLPPERDLARRLGVSRAELRKSLAVLKSEGRIWCHIGRGTFIGGRSAVSSADLAFLNEVANPRRVMEARLAIEPSLARLAALHAVRQDVARIERACRRCRDAREWRSYEAADDALHHAIALASQNKLLVDLFDRLNTVRRATVWGQLRVSRLPPRDHLSFSQHEKIARHIAARDPEGAERAMREHLVSVRDRILRNGSA